MTPQLSAGTFEKIVALCEKYKVCDLSLFGSRARGDFNDESDYDFLVEFFPHSDISLFAFSGMQVDLEEIIGKKVDLVSKRGLKPIIRERVLANAKIIFGEKTESSFL